jgi:SAM-dependent methyltransferase
VASESKPFAADVAVRGGYVYTTDASLSSRLANARITDAIEALADLRGKRVIDIGCGDGTYSGELVSRGGAAEVVGVDPAQNAVELAQQRHGSDRVSFQEGSAYALPFEPDSFEVAQLRGVLHHVDDPVAALREALRVAPSVVVMEPNGYNPGLKLLERVSPYHREHEERSFSARRIDGWVRGVGGDVVARSWIGQVPMFCPDRLARIAKRVEPLTEATPGLRLVSCAQYVFAARRVS